MKAKRETVGWTVGNYDLRACASAAGEQWYWTKLPTRVWIFAARADAEAWVAEHMRRSGDRRSHYQIRRVTRGAT